MTSLEKSSKYLVTITHEGKEFSVCESSIDWDEKLKSRIYSIKESQLSRQGRVAYFNVREILKSKDASFKNCENLFLTIESIIKEKHLTLTSDDIAKIKYFIYKDLFGFGPIEGLIRDDSIKEIVIDYPRTHINIFYDSIGILPTNITLPTSIDIDILKEKFKNRSINQYETNDYFYGLTPEGFLMFCDKSEKSILIRKLENKYNLLKYIFNSDMTTPEMVSYLINFIKRGKSIIIIGEKYCGKKALANAIINLLPSDTSIISFEETPSLILNKIKWIPEILDTHSLPNETIKSRLRTKANVILIENLKYAEKLIDFESSKIMLIDDFSISSALRKITNGPLYLPNFKILNFDIIIYMTKERVNNKELPKIQRISEIIDIKDGSLKISNIWDYNPIHKKYKINKSKLISKLGKSALENMKKDTKSIKYLLRKK